MKSMIFDLDGTIVKDGKLADLCIDVIRNCGDIGYKIGIATSRPYYTSENYASILKSAFLVASGGAFVSVNSDVISNRLIDEKQCSYILGVLSQMGLDDKVIIEGSNKYYCNFAECKTWIGFENAVVYLNRNPTITEAYKIIIPYNEKTESVLKSELLFAFEVAVYNKMRWIKISSKGTTKCSGVETALSHIGLCYKDVYFFGDDSDDLELIMNSAIGVAVGNANSPLTNYAKVICDSVDNNGVPKWILSNVL